MVVQQAYKNVSDNEVAIELTQSQPPRVDTEEVGKGPSIAEVEEVAVQTSEDSDDNTDSPPPAVWTAVYAVASTLRQAIVEHFILFALSIAILVAFAYPLIGKRASHYMADDIKIIEFVNNVLVFLISGITLKVEDMHSIVKYKYATLYGLVCINVITTFMAFVTRELPFKTVDFSTGLTIFCSVPTTLGVGVALTQISKGDSILSLFLTVVSNLLGIVTIPFLLDIYLNSNSSSSSVSIDPEALAYRLTLTVLIPTVAGIAMRKYIPGVPAWTKTYKTELSMFSMANLMTIVWMSLSNSRNTIFRQDIGEIILVFVSNIVIHCIYLLCNFFLMRRVWTGVPLRQAISIVIMASQKSSPVALSVIAIVAKKADQKGLLTIPCILGQLTQIFIGSVISRKFAHLVTADDEQQAAVEKREAEQKVYDLVADGLVNKYQQPYRAVKKEEHKQEELDAELAVKELMDEL